MKTLNMSADNKGICSKFPCNKCMSYIAVDIKSKSVLKNDDKRQILFYLQKISDRDVIREIIDLLKNISARY